MNRENVQAAINIMKRAGIVRMTDWQSGKGVHGHWRPLWRHNACATTEEEMHKCGNAACFAGWVAVSPEWQAAGGSSYEGSPCWRDENGCAISNGASAIADWLGVSYCLARHLVHGNVDPCSDDHFSLFYGKPWADVNGADVIAKLEAVLAGELE